MRNTIIIVISLVWTITSFSQTIPAGTHHIKFIDAVIFENNDTIESNRTVTYYDSSWHVLTNTNTLESALSKGTTTVTILDTPKKKQYADINKDGDTSSSIVYIYDDRGNRTEYFQIRNGDTINQQKRTYDDKGNNLTLWNLGKKDYYLRFEFEYDDSNNVVKRNYYNENGQITETVTTLRNYSKGTIKSFSKKPGATTVQIADITVKDGISISKHLQSNEGINYGITLIYEKGGYTETKEKGDEFEWMKIYNAKGELTTYVSITYEDYP